MTAINAVILSHEKETLMILKKFAEENYMIVQIIGVAQCISDGIVLIKSKKPDAIFLNIALEDDSFFEMLEQLEFSIPKLVLFPHTKSMLSKLLNIMQLIFY